MGPPPPASRTSRPWASNPSMTVGAGALAARETVVLSCVRSGAVAVASAALPAGLGAARESGTRAVGSGQSGARRRGQAQDRPGRASTCRRSGGRNLLPALPSTRRARPSLRPLSSPGRPSCTGLCSAACAVSSSLPVEQTPSRHAKSESSLAGFFIFTSKTAWVATQRQTRRSQQGRFGWFGAASKRTWRYPLR